MMFRAATLLLASLILVGSQPVLAQSSDPVQRPGRKGDPDELYRAPSSVHGKTILVPIGTTWEGRIDQTISSARSRNGASFNIVMSSPVLLNGTEVVVPAGSAIVGEVVEARPASSVPKRMGEDKRMIRGKLRIQISGLRTPDGVMHPLVASVAGDKSGPGSFDGDYQVPLGTSIGYVGSSASFEAVNVNRSKSGARYDSMDHRPGVVTKSELLKDPLLGTGEDGYRRDRMLVRSLVLKGRDYYIFEGSPITVRLQAPFKISVGSPGMGLPVSEVTPVEDELPPPTKASAATGGGGGANAPAKAGRGTIDSDSF